MLLPHSGAPPYTTSTYRRCRQNGCLLSCRQSPWLRQLGTLRHLGVKLRSSSSYSVNTRSRCNNATRTNQHLEDAERSPLAFDEVPCWLQSGDISNKSPWSGEPGYLNSRISIASSRRTFRSLADTRKLSVIPSRTKSGARAFRHSAPQVWNSTTEHPYNRSSQD